MDGEIIDHEALRREIRGKYRDVAVDPERSFDFCTGRPLAQRLGYPHSIVDALPDRAVESFAGVSNPFSLRHLKRGEKVVDVGSGAGRTVTASSHLYRQWRGTIDVTMRQSHKAGRSCSSTSPATRSRLDRRTGESPARELFVAVMGASNYLYAEAFPSQELLYWVTAHVHCFEALAGCPAIVVCDNLRSGVTRPHRYEPDVNATFAEMAATTAWPSSRPGL